MLESPWAIWCSNSGGCNLFISLMFIYPAYTHGIVCSREVCNKPKQTSPRSCILVILINCRRLFDSSSCLSSGRSDFCYLLLCSWDENDIFLSLSEKWITLAVERQVPVSVNLGSHADLFQLWFFNFANSIEHIIVVGMRSEVVSFMRCSWKKWVVSVNYFFHQFVPPKWFACSLSYDRWSNTRHYFSLQALPLLYPKTILATTIIMLLFTAVTKVKRMSPAALNA